MSTSRSTEHLYSPSEWTKRYGSSSECLSNHIDLITERSKLARQIIPGTFDIPYGKLAKEKYDLFGTDLPDEAPILFYIHGGYWQEECIGRANSAFIAATFHKYLIKSFIVGYELCPNVTLAEIVGQIQNALNVCLSYAKENRSSGIFLMGHSAGAHLVASLFTGFTKTLPEDEQLLLKTAFLIGGIYDLKPLLLTSYNEPLKLTPISAVELSPLEQEISQCDTHFVVVVGENDSPAFVEQSKIFEEKLKSRNLRSRIYIIQNIDHFDIIENLLEQDFDLTRIILAVVKKMF